MKEGSPKRLHPRKVRKNMKIVLVRAPRFIRGILSKIFGIEGKNK
jgi:hypothetical protein